MLTKSEITSVSWSNASTAIFVTADRSSSGLPEEIISRNWRAALLACPSASVFRMDPLLSMITTAFTGALFDSLMPLAVPTFSPAAPPSAEETDEAPALSTIIPRIILHVRMTENSCFFHSFIRPHFISIYPLQYNTAHSCHDPLYHFASYTVMLVKAALPVVPLLIESTFRFSSSVSTGRLNTI